MKIKDEFIYISGAALRIGRSLSIALAKQGAHLIIHYNRSKEDALSLKSEIEELGQTCILSQADFSDPIATQDHADAVFKSQKVVALINNASLFSNLSWDDTNLESWQKHLSINLSAPFLLSQSFARNLPENYSGRIINFLDWRALRPGIDHFPYTISKSALVALTKSLAISLAPQITVNGIALGAVLPPSDGGDITNITDALPVPRWAELDELHETILFLLSGPDYITGEIIHLDGGRHLV
jgi:NAD(P)-dependent dehydrogenase (short-subunit alcohol dehydrogenase family)